MPNDETGMKAELEAIKKLLVLMLLKQGTTRSDIAKALAVSPSSISRMMPSNIKPLER